MFSSQTVPIVSTRPLTRPILLSLTRPTLQRGDFFRRGSDETDESQFSSGLTTPVDDEVLQPFDRLVLEDPSCNAELRSSTKLGSGDCVHSKDSGSATAPKSRSLSKAVMKAKRFAQYLAKSNRFKVSLRPLGVSYQNFNMLF
jgi:hypothetical protein